MLDQPGVKMTMIRSEQSPQKSEAHPFAPLTDDAHAFLQGRINEAGVEFVKAVAAGRKTSQTNIREKFGQGRVYGARDAVAPGMVDRVATLDEVVSGLAQKSASRSAPHRRSALIID